MIFPGHASGGEKCPVSCGSQRSILGLFGFEPGTEYTVANPGVSYAFSQTPIHTGDTFTLDIRAENVFDYGRLAI